MNRKSIMFALVDNGQLSIRNVKILKLGFDDNQIASTYLIQSDISNTILTDVEFDTVGNILTSTLGNINFQNVRVKNLIPLSGIKNLLQLHQASFTSTNFEYDAIQDLVETPVTALNLFSGYSTFVNMTNLRLKNIKYQSGFLFILKSCSSYFINSEFENIISDKISQFMFVVIGGDSLVLDGIKSMNVLSILSSFLVNNVNITNSKFDPPENFIVFISISSAVAVNLDNISAETHGINKNIKSFISLEQVFTTIQLKDITLNNFNSSSGAITITNFYIGMKISIESSVFTDNLAIGSNGGVLSIQNITQNVSLLFKNCQFINNNAISARGYGGKGGAIYIATSNLSFIQPEIIFKNCSFQNNTSEISGGAIYIYNVPPVIDSSNFFKDNYAHGVINNVASQAVYLDKVIYRNLDENQVTNIDYIPSLAPVSTIFYPEVVSGIKNTQIENIAVFDAYGQVVFEEAILILESKTNLSLSVNQIRNINGNFSISNMVFNSTPGFTNSLKISTEGIRSFLNKPQYQNSNQKVEVVLEFRKCSLGEFLVEDLVCGQCPFGTTHYDLTPNYQGECYPCSEGVQCLGGSMVVPQTGYFRLNPNADVTLECLSRESCLGGTARDGKVILNQCLFGYEGNLCANCIPGYGKTKFKGECLDCSVSASPYLLVILAIFIAGLLIIIGVNHLVTYEREEEHARELTEIKIILLRTLVNLYQYISFIKIIPLNLPEEVNNIFDLFTTFIPSFSDSFNLDCLFSGFANNLKIEKIYLKALVFNMIPIFYIIFFIIFYSICFRAKRLGIRDRSELKRRIYFSLILIVFIFQPGIINEDLGLFGCLNLYREDQPQYYLIKNPDVKCWTENHMKWILSMAFPSLLIWMIGIILFIRRQMTLPKKGNGETFLFKFMRLGYKEKYSNFEILLMMKKILIIVAIYFLSYKPFEIQIYFTCLFFYIFWLIQKHLRVHSKQLYNDLTDASYVVCGLTCSTALFFRMDSEYMWSICVILTITSNVVFIMIWIHLYFRRDQFWLKMNQNLIKLFYRMTKRYPDATPHSQNS